MLITVAEFRRRVTAGRDDLVKELQSQTGRFGSEEAAAWKQSLPKLSRAFQSQAFQPLHLYFSDRGNIALEYQLPAASSWCDVVLLGKHKSRAAAVIIELKNWQTRSDKAGSYQGLIERHGSQDLHPSDQVRGYVEYCSCFHSAVLDYKALVSGCVLFTADHWTSAYEAPPNHRLTRAFPIFTTTDDGVGAAFPAFFEKRLSAPDPIFAEDFSRGIYKQERGFVAQIGRQILHPESKVFELLDGQRKAFALCQQTVAESFLTKTKKPPKRVVIVKGPPGSGKSAIAVRLWASLVTSEQLPEGNVVFTSTSLSQFSNLRHLFDKASEIVGSGGVVRKATGYSPVTTQRIGQLRKRHGAEFAADAGEWRENLQTMMDLGEEWRDGSRDNQNLISIVDEAHALINPEHASGRGQFGFAPSLGPQAYHIIRSSLLTVFFLDPLQGFRERENTTLEDLRSWSTELGAGAPVEVGLNDLQFRCAGSIGFVEWIESMLGGAPSEKNQKLAENWYRDKRARSRDGESGRLDFMVFDNPEDWESALRARIKDGSTARLLSTYSRPWKTKKATKPHRLSPRLMDFHESYSRGRKKGVWSRVWNFVPEAGNDYTWFVSAHPAGKIADDPLCEVGCTYAVRGFDFDYVGVLWLDDLRWRSDRWTVNPDAVHESGVMDLTRKVRRELKAGERGEAYTRLLDSIRQAYRIIFTRALKGVYVWIPDEETRRHVRESLMAESRLTTRGS